jgi:hypothetical protein
MANDECYFSLELNTLEGDRLMRDALESNDYPCTMTIGEFIQKLESKFNGRIVDITYGDGAETVLDMHELKLDETLDELYNKTGKDEANAFFAKMRLNKSNNTAGISFNNIGKLKKAEKNAKAAFNVERRNGNSRKALNAAGKVHLNALKALRNAQQGKKGGATRKNRHARKTRKNRK